MSFQGAADYIFPTTSDFQTQFTRDFPFFTGTPPYDNATNTIGDTDISNAMAEAAAYINPFLFPTQAQYTLGALRLSAHYMVMNLRASSQGLWGQYEWATTSKSAGAVSQGITLPERVQNNPMFQMLSKTNYGAQYFYMIYPQLIGQTFGVYAGSKY